MPSTASAAHSPPDFHPLNLLERWGPRKLNFLHMGIWTCLFGVMLSTGFLGHGQRFRADCQDGNAGACLAYGKILMTTGRDDGAKLIGAEQIGRACVLGSSEGCAELARIVAADRMDGLTNACTHGAFVSCYMAGWANAKGLGVPKNVSLATRYFEVGCERNFAPACDSLRQIRAGATA